ncbi:Uncharacterised protein [uncultured Clostridium sp.]|uniref:HK97 gp10 family phage protein n=1 Tax=uncultured Clostridium sp. TaxID=59620 RepID=UPI000821B35F|nr:HK97 gp10 family phage protein [uncultured Clostridium sp.]SCI99999.1 Uncharacterised protein [uncultured Clostridium sp.]
MLQSNIEIIKKQILKACGDAMDEIGITGTAELQSNAPVRNGTLRRSITFKKANSESKYSITFGSSLDYATYTEFRNKSKGWMRNTMNGLSTDARDIIIKHLGKVGK